MEKRAVDQFSQMLVAIPEFCAMILKSEKRKLC